MDKRILLTAGLVCLLGAGAFGAAPLGPPTAGLEQDQISAGFAYAHSEGDFKADWDTEVLGRTDIKDFESDAYLFRLGWGAADDLEISALIGAADASADIEGSNLNGDYALSGGFGLKYTFLKQGRLSFGFLYQILWGRVEDSFLFDLSPFGGSPSALVDGRFRWRERVVAVGPTYEMEKLQIYGALAAFRFDGNIEMKFQGFELADGDVDEDSQFGGYLGAQLELGGNKFLHLDYQLSGDASVLGFGLTGKF